MKYTHLLSCVFVSLLLVACKVPTDAEIQQRINRLQAPAELNYAGSQTLSNKKQKNVASQLFTQIDLADDVYLDSAPQRYVVKKGDSLWGIAKRFLKSPAYWSSIWHTNPKVKNPNRIYPGDVLSYVMKKGERKLQIAGSNSKRIIYTGKKTNNGLPIYKINPTIKEEEIKEPIPVMPKDIISQFTAKSLVLDEGKLANAPYILSRPNGENVTLTLQDTLFAKGDFFEEEEYDLYRLEGQLTSPSNQEYLGHFARYVGSAKVNEILDEGLAKLERTSTYYAIEAGDILLSKTSTEYGVELDYLPKLANVNKDAVIVKSVETESVNASQFGTVLIDKGKNDGVNQGDVFKIVPKHNDYAEDRNGQAVALPDRMIGIGMVYKVFDQSSYVIVLESNAIISEGDRLVKP